MKPFVLDASAAVAWCFNDEATPESIALLGSLQSRTAVVPVLWRWEVINVLLVAERRQRIGAAVTNLFLRLLEQLPISVDEGSSDVAIGNALRLARERRLSSYDAAYLELALRLDLPLATRDGDLAEAARAMRIQLLPT